VEGSQPKTGTLTSRPPTVLTREASVQGSVVLRAVIDRQGQIRELAVVKGPADLTAAAIEAARNRRFQPYLQNGQPVETETLITVDFNISAQ
jgi:protein TonB